MIRALVVLTAIGLGVLVGMGISNSFSAGDEQIAFDKGMKAGVEYQTWFCENDVIPFSPAPKE